MAARSADKAQEVFAAALTCPPEQRAALLAELCAGDAELRAEVESLLAHDAAAPADFLEKGVGSLLPERPAWCAAQQTPDPFFAVGQRIGQYTLKALIASGGMGTVYLAEQDHPRRDVALKIIRPELASRSGLRRFEVESQLLAELRHPHIAHVYEAGIHEELGPAGPVRVPFFAMEYVAGARPITDYAHEHTLGTPDRLRLFLQVCEAVQHGHQRGIIHRDLKPANILVDGAGQVKVIDFGVARATDGDVTITTLDSGLGSMVGTLQYMSPEQCLGDPQQIDVRSDVYALGVVLYELICGQRPYDVGSSSILEGARIVREQAAARPSRINRVVRGDLETIILKALEKDRDRRYASVSEFGADLRRCLEHEPIMARPPTAAYLVGRFIHRRPWQTAAMLAMATCLVTIPFLVGLWWYADKAHFERRRAEMIAYGARMAEVEAALRINDSAGARRILDVNRPEPQPWEWWHLSSRVDMAVAANPLPSREQLESYGVSLSPDGESVAIAQGCLDSLQPFPRRNPPSALPAPEGGLEVYRAAFGDSPDELATISLSRSTTDRLAEAYFATIWRKPRTSAEYERVAHRQIGDGSSGVRSLAFAGRHALLAVGFEKGFIRVWKTDTLEKTYQGSELGPVEPLLELRGHDDTVLGLAWSPDGQWLASAGDDHTVRLWRVESASNPGKRTTCVVIRGHAYKVMCVAFDPHGLRIASGSLDGTVRLWDVDRSLALAEQNGGVAGCADVVPEEIGVLAGHQGGVFAVVFDDTGGRLASGGTDRAVRVWDVREQAPLPDSTYSRYYSKPRRELVTTLRGHEDSVWALRWLSDGTLLSAGQDGSVREWAPDTAEIPRLAGHTSSVGAAAFAPDDRHILTFGDQSIIIWDAERCVPVWRCWLLRGGSNEHLDGGVVWDRDGTTLVATAGYCQASGDALGKDSGRLLLWELQQSAGEARLELPSRLGETPRGFHRLAVSADGRRLAATSLQDGSIQVWEAADSDPRQWAQIAMLAAGNMSGSYITFVDPAGDWLASAPGLDYVGTTGLDSRVHIWKVDGGSEEWTSPALCVCALGCDPVGQVLFAGLKDGRIARWRVELSIGNVSVGEPEYLVGHTAEVSALALHPCEERLISGGWDGVLKVWDPVLATEVATLRTQIGQVSHLAFSGDGARLVSCSVGIQGLDNVARLWDTEISPETRRNRAVAMRAYAAVREVLYHRPASPQEARRLIADDQYLPQNVKDFAADHFESLLPHPEKIVMLVQSLVRAQPASAEVRSGAAEWFALVTKVAPEYVTLDEVLAQP